MKQDIAALLERAFAEAARAGGWSSEEAPAFTVEVPKDPTHGDFATNLAMVSAKVARTAPRKIADALVAQLHALAPGWLESIEIAGPGFINFRIRAAGWFAAVDRAVEAGDRYGRVNYGEGRKVLVEYVSANPTGPLHVGHARICAVGSALASVLDAAGFEVLREYYVNDAGLQMEMLGRTLWIRYQQHFGVEAELPEDHYQGAYMAELAGEVAGRIGRDALGKSESEVLETFQEEAAGAILQGIVEDMRNFGVEFDTFASERELFVSGKVDEALNVLREKGFLYDSEGATWFASSRFGDEKDRVVVRENKAATYFASDIAYHREKFRRGFDRLVNIWGADHHGYVPRLRGAMQAFGYETDRLDFELVQFVSLVRGGKPVQMSTRRGTFDTLRDLIDEVGKDAARYLFLLRSVDSAMEFDLDVATAQTMENPVFYVQYAHARICSFFAKAADAGMGVDLKKPLDPALLDSPEELELARQLARLPETIETCARNLSSHHLAHFLMELARSLHSFYTAKDPETGASRFKVVDPENPERSRARLKLVHAVALALRNGLNWLGVSAPERMERLVDENAEEA